MPRLIWGGERSIETDGPPGGPSARASALGDSGSAGPPRPGRHERPAVRGKFFFLGDRKLYVTGVTYGTFAPTASGEPFDPGIAETDFLAMRASGVNAVRVYDVPPRWLLDLALERELFVLVGLPWEQHVAFLDEGGRRARSITERVRAGVRACAGHPAILGYAIGNEIPAPIVRWHGRRRIERFVRRLYQIVKSEDPEGLVTYVNYPSTEYLQLGFLDFACFNVYLERRDRLEAYLARLQNVAGDQPLLMTELGLDSRRNGEQAQAEVLGWQIRAAYEGACAGVFVFAWTDEWHRGEHAIDDWDFGIVRRDRSPKPALKAVSEAFAAAPLPRPQAPPTVSVIVCTYNGARTLDSCLSGLARIDYPEYEVMVVSDGSTDATAEIASRYDVKLVETENGGLARARNTGLGHARGDVIAYIDDDACPDPGWLSYVVHRLQTSDHVGVGGPNLSSPEDGRFAQAAANAPGGCTHVLLDDVRAEHIPGVNMAFWRWALEEVDGFDPQFVAAGDDVDLCWRILERGWTIGFSPGAVVWHHRRGSMHQYWRQQRGYGKAEAMLERKWPEKYSPAGNLGWAGRLYGNGSAKHHGGPRWRWRIYYGAWGSGAFQSLYRPAPDRLLAALPLMPEWYLVIALLAVISAAGSFWRPLLLATPLLLCAVGVLVFNAVLGGARATFPFQSRSFVGDVRLRALTACLYLLQPLARLFGRVTHGLTPWRRHGPASFQIPCLRTATIWSERWRPADEWVKRSAEQLRHHGAVVLSGGDWDRWDLELRGGTLGVVRMRLAVEEHGAGRQLIRLRWWPRVSSVAPALLVALGAGALAAVLAGAPISVAVVLLALTAVLAGRVIYECGNASGLAATVSEPTSVTRNLVVPSSAGAPTISSAEEG